MRLVPWLMLMGLFVAIAILCIVLNLVFATRGATINQDNARPFWDLQQGLKQDHEEMKAALARIEEKLEIGK